MKWLHHLAALLLAVASAPAVAQVQHPALPGWLAGTWAMERGAEWAEELWTAPRGNAMVGLSRSGFGPDIQGWQWLRIVRQPDGDLALLAQDRGGAVAEFRLAFASAEAIEFASGRNEFPQRIRFARAGQLLTIEQSRMDGSEAVLVNYRPVETAPKD
ncbi:MAG TPA: DUF6265 family protein [Novosphingobium sp.]